MKKNIMRLIAILLILMLLMGTLISFAETVEESSGENPVVTTEPDASESPKTTEEPEMPTDPEVTDEPETTVDPEVTLEPETTVEPEATVEPEVTLEPETTVEPEGTVEPEATDEPEVTGEPEMTMEPEVTEEPETTMESETSEEPIMPIEEVAEDELTTSPVDNSTTLPDGEYVPTSCTGGSSKVSFSCPMVTVKDGKATATLVISSSKYDYVKASGNKYETSAYSGGGVYANIPIDLNTDNRIVGHTTAMGGKEIEYTIHITLDEASTSEPTPAPTPDPGEDTEHTVETDNKMFKIIRSVLRMKDGKYTATITLSGTGYDMVYCGTAEQAASNSANWISYSGEYSYEDDGEVKTGYVFNIPVSAVNEPIPLAAHSVKKDEWMDRSVTFTVAVTETTPEPTEEPGEETEHTVETDNKMFKIIRSVLTLKDGSYSAQITLSGTGYDKLYCGTAAQAENDSANWISYSGEYNYEDDGEAKTGYVFNIPVSAVNQPIPLAAHSVKKDEWMDRNVTFTVTVAEPTPEPSEEPTATPEPTPTPTPTPAPSPVILGTPGKVNSSTSLQDGTYTPDKFSWSGGSGRTSISCSKVTVKNGKAYATISFSSDSYAYVKANGQKYYGSVVGGRSTFEIPVKLNANNKIVGMTTAMSADHEIAYTIYVYLKAAEAASSGNAQSTTVPVPEAAQITGLEYISTDAIAHSWLYKVHRYSQGCVAIEVVGVGKYLVVPENAELPVGIEEEAVIIRQPIMGVHSSSTNAMQMIQGIIGEETEMTISFWDYTAPNYAALLKSGSDLIIMPESFAGNDDAAIADVRERLDMLGIPMFVDRSADEETEAAKLEWIKVYGILMGCEEAANACYETAVAALEVQA